MKYSTRKAAFILGGLIFIYMGLTYKLPSSLVFVGIFMSHLIALILGIILFYIGVKK